MSGRRDEIARAIQAHQVVIVCGETGSGKTTQLPKIALTLEVKDLDQLDRIVARLKRTEGVYRVERTPGA